MKKYKDYPLNEVEPFSTLKEMLTKRANADGDKIAYKFIRDGKHMQKTYKEFYLDTVYLGTALAGMGFLNKHIACIGPNSYDWLTVYLSVLCSNNVFIPIDKDLPAGDIINIINHSDADAVIFAPKYESLFLESTNKLQRPVKFISMAEESEFDTMPAIMEQGRKSYDSGDTSYTECKPNKTEDLKAILYTSGTTGNSKGVMLSEKNLVSCVYYGLKISDVSEIGLSVLPYHHTYESACDILVSLHKGNTICINENIKSVVKSLAMYQPKYIMLVPAFAELFYSKIQKKIKSDGKEAGFKLLVMLSRALRCVGIDVRRKFFAQIHQTFGGRLEKIVCGGAPIRPEIGRFFDDIGIMLLGGYGITECSPLVSCHREGQNDPTTVGAVLPCIKVEIDSPMDDGIGEIKVKGDTVMLGYYKAEEMTAEVLKDGWFYTGDYGKYSESGQLMVTGRKKNLIVLSNGKNIFPEEIEEYISSIPEVKEVVVYSKKTEDGNEKGLSAQVYLDPETPLEASELKKKIQAVLAELPSYKQIQELIIREEEFEKTTSNKIKRQAYIN